MSLSVHRVCTGQCTRKSRLVRARSSAVIAAVCQVAAGTPFLISAHVVGADLDSADGTFCERFGLGSDGAVLVRPDGHIAWRREAGTVEDCAAELRAAIAVATGCRAAEKGTVVAPLPVA